MKKTRFNLIDAAIVIVVLAVMVIGIKMLKVDTLSNSANGKATFTVLASKYDEGTGEIIKPGDEVSISFSEQAFATVISVSEEPCKEHRFISERGVYVTHELEGKCDLKIVLSCPASVSDTEIANGEVPIRVGSEMPVRGKGYTVKGYVIELEAE